MNRNFDRRALAAGGILAVTLVTAFNAPAVASAMGSSNDARHDVTMFLYDHDGDGETQAVHPKDKARADIVQFRTAHHRQRINMRLRIAEVKRARNAEASGSFVVRTDAARLWFVDTSYYRGRTTVTLLRHYANRALQEFECDGLLGDTLPKTDQLRVSLPRDCVKDPTWVRTGAVASFARLADPYRSWADRARSDGAIDPNSDGKFALGPRIRRN